MNPLGKAFAYYRERGGLALARRVRHGIWHRERYIIYCKTLSIQEMPPAHQQVLFRTAVANDVPSIASNWPNHLTYVGPDVESVLHTRLQEGDRATVGVCRENTANLVFMAWASKRDYALLTLLGGAPKPAQACVKNVWVAEPYRRQGVAAVGLGHVERAAQDRHIDRLWAFVMPANVASRRLFERLNYRESGTVCFAETLGRKKAMLNQNGFQKRLRLCSTGTVVP